MSEGPVGEERFLRQLVGSMRCHVCRRTFNRRHVRVAARHDEIWVVSVRCTLCRHQQVFWISLKDEDAGLMLDASAAEEERFAQMEPVSADDVLDMHLFLRHFDGDFEDLFS